MWIHFPETEHPEVQESSKTGKSHYFAKSGYIFIIVNFAQLDDTISILHIIIPYLSCLAEIIIIKCY